MNNNLFLHKNTQTIVCPDGATQFYDSIVTSSQYMSNTTTMVGNVCFPKCTKIESGTEYGSSAAFSSCVKLTKITMLKCQTLGSCAFRNCTSLSYVEFNKCTTIGYLAFCSCANLVSVSFPKCTYIGQSCFFKCSNLSYVYFPKVSRLNSYIFYECMNIKDINKISEYFPILPNVTANASKIDHYAFHGTGITYASFPQCTSIQNSAFEYCYNLATISFPKCTYIGGSAFDYCSSLTSVYFPLCSYIAYQAFACCLSLNTINFPKIQTIINYAFYYCPKLTTAYIGTSISTVCSMSTSSVFERTQITSTTGSIYVPASLLTAYKNATGWSYFSNRIFGV